MTDAPDAALLRDFDRLLARARNAGRWGADDEVGTPNLITRDHVIEAGRLIVSGETFSLARPIHPEPGSDDTRLEVFAHDRGSSERLTISCHGYDITHIDALCHHWSEPGAYNDRVPSELFDEAGHAQHLDVSVWHRGLVTRAVLLDVPGFRGVGHVAAGLPVHDAELREICRAQNVDIRPGDAVAVYSGRDDYDLTHDVPWPGGSERTKPGLNPSIIRFLRDVDASVLVWDMMDDGPYDTRHTVHQAITSLGLAMVDNASLGDLARACRADGRYEFHLTVAPLFVPGATGSAVNPIAAR